MKRLIKKYHFDLFCDPAYARSGTCRLIPMIAPNYAAAPSQLAKQMGLGQRRWPR